VAGDALGSLLSQYLHFITFCCYHRKRMLDSARCREMAVRIQEKVEKQ
jgi:hypothetical protein